MARPPGPAVTTGLPGGPSPGSRPAFPAAPYYRTVRRETFTILVNGHGVCGCPAAPWRAVTPRCPPGIPGGQRVAGGESQLWRQVALKFWPLVNRETVSFRLPPTSMMILAG